MRSGNRTGLDRTEHKRRILGLPIWEVVTSGSIDCGYPCWVVNLVVAL